MDISESFNDMNLSHCMICKMINDCIKCLNRRFDKSTFEVQNLKADSERRYVYLNSLRNVFSELPFI